ncbi:MAG: biotin--[acetyl-CoA-carboxylase] ligase [Rhabdochlamydiaceae bacterium]|nr:biotin--[acetyl-CoA-carboxylase] ligase [Candidatus Amphrikana amoebophyrae]
MAIKQRIMGKILKSNLRKSLASKIILRYYISMFIIEKSIPVFLDHVDSTNLYAKKNIKNFDPKSLTAISTSYQTTGLTTKKSYWHSKENENILNTFVFKYKKNALLHQYGQVLSVAVLQLLNSLKIQGTIKWPNDILINNKKIAGILATPDTENQMMILGIGLNVNLTDTSFIDQPATSIHLETDHSHSVKQVLNQLTNLFLKNLNLYHEKGFEAFLTDYVQNLAFIDKKMVWNEITGTLRSVSLEGYLLLEDELHHMHEIKWGRIMPHKTQE